jgi:hypothetical protein
MRLVIGLLAIALAACANQPTCPQTIGLYCGAEQEGLTCDYAEESGATASCHCSAGGWTCNDCPNGDAPVGTCSAGQACSVWAFETACDCTCDTTGQWSCAVGDPDPNFHCGL